MCHGGELCGPAGLFGAKHEPLLADTHKKVAQVNRSSFEQLTSLSRFTTAITNSGSADFRPAIPKLAWDWHACHQHYHSMEVFSHFEIMDQRGRRVVEGHKVLIAYIPEIDNIVSFYTGIILLRGQ